MFSLRVEHEQADAGRYAQARLASPNSQARTGTGKYQMTTSRIDNVSRLIHTLLYVMTIHTHCNTVYVMTIHTHCSNTVYVMTIHTSNNKDNDTKPPDRSEWTASIRALLMFQHFSSNNTPFSLDASSSRINRVDAHPDGQKRAKGSASPTNLYIRSTLCMHIFQRRSMPCWLNWIKIGSPFKKTAIYTLNRTR